jgi:hypothetical protein
MRKKQRPGPGQKGISGFVEDIRQIYYAVARQETEAGGL